jgi:predicted MFS family arabinose efflux permease
VFAAMLGGAALVSFGLARYGDVIGRLRAYAGLLVVMGMAGTAFALTESLPVLLLAALTGTLSTDVVESGPFTSLEQAMLPAAAGAQDPTRLFGTYNTIATLAGSLGALASAVPALVDGAEQRWLLLYAAMAAVAVVIALGLSAAVDSAPGAGRASLRRSRSMVRRLAGLFALDSFAGGFVIQSFIAYFFVTKFGTSPATLGVVFFALGILQAVSFEVAVRLASRIGLLRTMVFTHLPSNVLLAAIAFAPTQALAIALLLARSLLSQMDVPTRQAYVVALVDPDERTAAAAYTNAARYASRPFAPLLIGPLLTVGLGAPFVVAGALKSAYDLSLYGLFRDPPLEPAD